MKVVIQRVSKAKVEVNDSVICKINQGFLILLGTENSDSQEDVNWLVNKILNLRVFSDDELKMNLSIKDIKGEIIVVSQFTLHAKTKKGSCREGPTSHRIFSCRDLQRAHRREERSSSN